MKSLLSRVTAKPEIYKIFCSIKYFIYSNFYQCNVLCHMVYCFCNIECNMSKTLLGFYDRNFCQNFLIYTHWSKISPGNQRNSLENSGRIVTIILCSVSRSLALISWITVCLSYIRLGSPEIRLVLQQYLKACTIKQIHFQGSCFRSISCKTQCLSMI